MNPVTLERLQKAAHVCDGFMLAVGVLMILYVEIGRAHV